MSKKASNPPPEPLPPPPSPLEKMDIGNYWLITTDNWFFAPDGHQYSAVWGMVHSIQSDADIVGMRTNRHSTDWYVVIGNMIIAGCQVHYAIQCDSVNTSPIGRETEHEGKIATQTVMTRIYNTEQQENRS